MQSKVETFVLDTNVVLRFLVQGSPVEHAEIALQIVMGTIEGKFKVIVPAVVIEECVFVLEKEYERTKEEVAGDLIAFLALINVRSDEIDEIKQALILHADLNIDFEDALIRFHANSDTVSGVVTFDHRHFNRFGDLNVIKPVDLAKKYRLPKAKRVGGFTYQ